MKTEKIKQHIRIGTDCSGIEAPVQALQNLRDKYGITYEQVFSSDIDKYVIQSIEANYGTSHQIFGDITERDVSEIKGDIDLYVAGFPCQTFSTAGKRKGFDDKRGIIFWECAKVIRAKKPKYFILENVKGLLTHNKGESFKVIWDEITSISTELGYYVDYKVLNTRDYGIPQNRERVYIIGINERSESDDEPSREFTWPSKEERGESIEKFVDRSDTVPQTTSERLTEYINSHSANTFIELQHCSFGNRQNPEWCPCITANSRMWCVPMNRRMNVSEMMSLQGVREDFVQVVSNSQMKKQIGNSMSVNVIEKILLEMFIV